MIGTVAITGDNKVINYLANNRKVISIGDTEITIDFDKGFADVTKDGFTQSYIPRNSELSKYKDFADC